MVAVMLRITICFQIGVIWRIREKALFLLIDSFFVFHVSESLRFDI